MQSKRKSNGVIGHSLTGNFGPEGHYSGAMVFTVEGVGTFGIEMNRLNPEINEQAAIHGLVQKVSDRAAIGRDPETGASASPVEKFAAMKECADRLMAGGPWNAVPTGGTGSTGGLLYRAMRALYPNAWSDRVTFAAYIAEKAISESARVGKEGSENDVRTGLRDVKRGSKEIQ